MIPFKPGETKEFLLNCQKPEGGDAEPAILSENLREASFNVHKILPCGTESHHIVAKADPAATISRKILTEMALININDARNGVALPGSPESQLRVPGFVHQTSHSSRYHEEVETRLLATIESLVLVGAITSTKTNTREAIEAYLPDETGETRIINKLLVTSRVANTLSSIAEDIVEGILDLNM